MAQLLSKPFLLSCGSDIGLPYKQRIYLPNHSLLKADIKMCLDFLIVCFLVKKTSPEFRGYCVKELPSEGVATDHSTHERESTKESKLSGGPEEALPHTLYT